MAQRPGTTTLTRTTEEPAVTDRPTAGSSAASPWAPVVSRILAACGRDLRALVLGGSHATGDAVWAAVDGRAGSLSDLDLYVVMRDRESATRAAARAHADRAGLSTAAAACGLVAPLEPGFLAEAEWRALPARPATLELARAAVLLDGDAAVCASRPRPRPRDVGAEERLRLIENRAFELLEAFLLLDADEPWARLRVRHATYKVAADFATVLALDSDEWPAGLEARIAWARGHLASAALGGREGGWDAPLGRLWDDAVRWRRNPTPGDPTTARDDWYATARLWTTFWERLAPEPGIADPWRRAGAVSRRARWRRRLRLALRPEPATGAPSWTARLRYGWRGTPAHRVHASAAILLESASRSNGEPALPAGALHALAALGVTRARDWRAAARDAVRAWRGWVLGDTRVEPGA